jgi:hypothetical protein
MSGVGTSVWEAVVTRPADGWFSVCAPEGEAWGTSSAFPNPEIDAGELDGQDFVSIAPLEGARVTRSEVTRATSSPICRRKVAPAFSTTLYGPCTKDSNLWFRLFSVTSTRT